MKLPWTPKQRWSLPALNFHSVLCVPLSGSTICLGFLIFAFSVSATESLSQWGTFSEPVSSSIKLEHWYARGSNKQTDIHQHQPSEKSPWAISSLLPPKGVALLRNNGCSLCFSSFREEGISRTPLRVSDHFSQCPPPGGLAISKQEKWYHLRLWKDKGLTQVLLSGHAAICLP